MRTASPPLQTVCHAAIAAVVALAVAAPTPFVLDRLLTRTAPPPAASGPLERPGTARVPAGTTTGAHARRPKQVPLLPGPGMPGSISQALKTSPLVVVALYAAGDPVDMAAGGEAQAGAELAGAPYVAVNIGDESQIGDLASRLPTLTVPAVALLGKGGTVLTVLDGYVDRQAVAGAIDTARRP